MRTVAIKKIIGNDSFGLVKGLSLHNKIEDVREVEIDGDCYESDSPLNNLQSFCKLLANKKFVYKYVYFFDDITQKISEINLFLKYDNDVDNNITYQQFEDLLAQLKTYFTNKYGISKVENDKDEVYFHFETQSLSPNVEIVLVEYIEDDEESSIEKTLKIIWQEKL